MVQGLRAVAEAIRGVRRVAVASHLLADGDCLGSTLGLGLALEAHGWEVTMLHSQPVPESYRFLRGSERLICPEELAAPLEVELAIILDCTDWERLGEPLATILKGQPRVINIDHHISNARFGHLNLVEPRAAATGELVYRLLRALRLKPEGPVATALFVALSTDTGSFKFENTSPSCLRVASALLRAGADLALVRVNLWETNSLARLRLLGKVLPTLDLNEDGRIAWMRVSQDILCQCQACPEDSEGFVDYAKSVHGVEVGVLFREEEGGVKVSLRSKTTFDVNELARLFGGGGHVRAAGCTIAGPMEVAVEMVVQAAEELMPSKLKTTPRN